MSLLIKIPLIIIFILAALFLLLFIIYSASSKETTQLNEKTRSQLAGSFIKLKQGYTHYELAGPQTGKLIVLVHGAGPALDIWNKQVGALINGGYQVLLFDRYGAGYSDRLQEYSWDIFADQVIDLVDALRLPGQFDIDGRSYGTKVAAVVAYKYPDRVGKLILTSGGLNTWNVKPSFGLDLAKLAGRFFYRVLGVPAMKAALAKTIKNSEDLAYYQNAILDQFRFKGTEEAAIELVNKNILTGYLDVYEKVFSQNREILLIWGGQDKIINSAKILSYLKEYPQVKSYVIPESGHLINFIYAEEYNRELLAFLAG